MSPGRLHPSCLSVGLTILVAAIAALPLRAQRAALTLLTGPSAAYRTLTAAEGFAGVAALWDEAERVAVLPELGLRHSQPISARGYLSGTVMYSVLGYDYPEASLRLGSQWKAPGVDPGVPPEPAPVPLAVVGHRFHYLTVPIEYAYAVLDDWPRVSLSVRGGAEPGVLVRQYTRLRANDGSHYSRDLDADLQGFSVSLRASLSLAYELNPDWTIVAEPNYRHQVTPLSSGNLTTRLKSAGVLVGVQRAL